MSRKHHVKGQHAVEVVYISNNIVTKEDIQKLRDGEYIGKKP